MDTSGLTTEQVDSLTDEDIAACAAAQLGYERMTLSADARDNWRRVIAMEHALWPKAVSKAREILAARRACVVGTGGQQARYKPGSIMGWLEEPCTSPGCSCGRVNVTAAPPPAALVTVTTTNTTAGSMDGWRFVSIGGGEPAAPSLPDASDAIFRFLCGLDGTVTARWLSVEDQREFERLRRGLGEALMAMGRGRR